MFALLACTQCVAPWILFEVFLTLKASGSSDMSWEGVFAPLMAWLVRHMGRSGSACDWRRAAAWAVLGPAHEGETQKTDDSTCTCVTEYTDTRVLQTAASGGGIMLAKELWTQVVVREARRLRGDEPDDDGPYSYAI